MQKKKTLKFKSRRFNDSSRSLTDPNLKNVSEVNLEFISDSTPNVSKWNPNLPPTGLSRSKSPKPSKSCKSSSSHQNFADNQDFPSKIGKPIYQQSRYKFLNNPNNSSLLSSLSLSPSPLSLSTFEREENRAKLSKEHSVNEASTYQGKSKPRLSLTSSHQTDQDIKSGQSPSPKSPISKMTSFKGGFASPDTGKNKFMYYPNYTTISSKKLALLRKRSLPSETFILKFDLDDPGELISSPPGLTLGQAIQTSVVKKGLTMNTVEVYLDSSKTPLPMSSDTYLLANNVLWVKVKEMTSKRSSTSSNSGSQKRQNSLTRFKKILTSLEDVRVSESGESQQKVKVNHKGRLPSWLGSFSKQQQDKQDQLNELLEQYSQKGLPKMPDLLTLGRPSYDRGEFKLEKHWTAVVSDELSCDLGKHERDQQEALWELLVTEVEYIEKLQVITDLFVCCLINLQNELILNEIEVDKLCSNVVDILYASYYFWTTHLSNVIKSSRQSNTTLNPSMLKEGFLEFDNIFEPYKKYCLEQEVCRDYIKNKLKENELFRIFIRWAESQPQCKRLKLTDLIISPFQRLTRYKLLLYAIQRPIIRHINHAPPHDDAVPDQSWPGCLDDKRDIDLMVEQVEKFVYQLNVAMRLSQDHQQLSQIVDKIEAYEIIEPPNEECAKLIQKFSQLDLTMPMHGCGHYDNRTLIHEGSLKLKDINTKCDVQCYLFTDMFMVTRSTFKKSEKVKFKVIKPPMRLDKIVVYELKDGGSFIVLHLNEFHLVQSVLFLSGESKLWVDAITKAQKDYKEKRRSFSRKSDLSHVLYDDPNDFRPLTFDSSSCKSKVSDMSRRSTSVNESFLRHGGPTELSPINFSMPPLSLLRGGDDDDEDGGMFSSIIKFAAKKSVSQQTSDGLEQRSRPQGSTTEIKVKGHEGHSFIMTSDEAATGSDSGVFHRRNKSVDATSNLNLNSSQRRSRSSDDVTPNDDLSLPVCGTCRLSVFDPSRFTYRESISTSIPVFMGGSCYDVTGYDDDDDDVLEVCSDDAAAIVINNGDDAIISNGDDAIISNDDDDDDQLVEELLINDNYDEDDVSVFSGSFRMKDFELT